MKATYFFTETNSRLEMRRKNRRTTIEIPDELFRHYDVEGMEKCFRTHMKTYGSHDSTFIINSIKIGNTHFQL